jgi:hypothetical protein
LTGDVITPAIGMNSDNAAPRPPDNRLMSCPNLGGDLVCGAATGDYARRAVNLETAVNLSEGRRDNRWALLRIQLDFLHSGVDWIKKSWFNYITITGFTPGTIYIFQVRALIHMQFTDWSDPVTKICQ